MKMPELSAAEIHARVLVSAPDLYLKLQMHYWSDEQTTAWYHGELADSIDRVKETAKRIEEWIHDTYTQFLRAFQPAAEAMSALAAALERQEMR